MLDTELLSVMVANKQGEGKKHGGSSHSQHKQRVIISYGDKQGEEKEHDGSSHAELFYSNDDWWQQGEEKEHCGSSYSRQKVIRITIMLRKEDFIC